MRKVVYKKTSKKEKHIAKKLEKEFHENAPIEMPKLSHTTKNFIYILIGMAIVLGIILVIAEYYQPDVQNNGYNGYPVRKGVDGLWHIKVLLNNNEYDIPLHYHPREVENISVYGDLNSFFRLMKKYGLNGAYITFNPVQPTESLKHVALASSEISLSLAQVFNIRPIAACAINATGSCGDRPIVDCSSDDKMVIYIKESPVDITSVSEDTNCIVVQGLGENLVKASERLLYQWFGVIRK